MKRIITIAALLAATTIGIGLNAYADETKAIRAQGNPYLTDFMSLSAKRADLRSAVSSKGLDVAFSEWFHREHPLELQKAGLTPAEHAAHHAETAATKNCCTMPATENDPRMADFQSLSAKRADLRVNVIQKGLERAFADWLKAERGAQGTPKSACCCR